MKKLLLILAMCIATNAWAQYESFFGKNSTSYSQFYTFGWWNKGTGDIQSAQNHFSVIGNGFTFDSYFTKEDTVRINDILYYKTSYLPDANTNAPSYYPEWGFWYGDKEIDFEFYLREDTTNGKLYYYYAGDETEKLWCDMSLSVGDTFYIPSSFYYFFGGGGSSIVDSIRYINNKKIIYFPITIAEYFNPNQYPNYHSLQLKFIEGIGPLYGPAVEIFNGETIHHTLLLCVHKDDTLTFRKYKFSNKFVINR